MAMVVGRIFGCSCPSRKIRFLPRRAFTSPLLYNCLACCDLSMSRTSSVVSGDESEPAHGVKLSQMNTTTTGKYHSSTKTLRFPPLSMVKCLVLNSASTVSL